MGFWVAEKKPDDLRYNENKTLSTIEEIGREV